MSLKEERELNPTSRDQVNRAKNAAQSKNFDYAITLLQAALKDEPLFLKGRQLLRAVEIQKFKAMSSFTRQMASMRLSGALKLSSNTQKTPEEQLLQAEEILVQDPYNLKANELMAEAGMALGYAEFKCFAYETVKEGKPGDKVILNKLAQAYMESKNFPKAVATYESILEIDKRDGDALSGLKDATAAQASVEGKWEAAKEAGDFRESLKSRSESNQLEQESKVVKSLDAIQEQINLNFQKHEAEPNNPNHSKAIAQLYVQKNDYASAVPWYEHAFEAGNRVDSSLEKTIGDLKLKKVEQELQALRQELAAQTEPEQQAQTQTAIELKEKELNDVRLFLAEARVRAQPNEGEFRYDLGDALFKIGQYKRATEELQQSLKQPSVRYQALNLMGLAFMKRGMLDFAVKQLSLAESELPVMDEIKKEISYNLGLAYEFDMSYRDVAARVEASYGNVDQAA